MNDEQFRQLLNLYEFSWSGYRKVRKGVKKRIHRYMKSIKCNNMKTFLAKLEKNKALRHEFELLMTVSISRFFRNRLFWQGFKENILPEFMDVGREKIKVWSAGCACGEEVYSFKIIWNLASDSDLYVPNLEIWGTDINPIYLDRARSGIYTHSSLKEVSKEIQSEYFVKKDGKNLFEVKESLKKGIIWKVHHLLLNPPESDFDIIFLRNNVLTYYKERPKQRAFNNVLKSLASSGIIVLGSHEMLPFETTDLISVKPYPFVFRKNR